MIITSKDNSIVKLAASLKDKRTRDESKKYLIEGYRSVRDSLPSLVSPLILLSETASLRYGDEFGASDVTVIADKVFSRIADTESSQGVVCLADIVEKEPTYENKFALFLDRVRDPGNFGTIIRTALAVGFTDLYCYDCVDAYNPKVVRSSMSALSRVNIFKANDLTVQSLKQNGYTFVCADMSGENIFSTKQSSAKICLAVGNEANGLSEEVRNCADKVLSLPMEGVESLNVAISAAVLMYNLRYGTNINN